jgi:hypothetical protein
VSFLCGRKRSQSAGSGKFEKKFSKDDIYRREDEGEGEGDGGGSDSARKSSSGSEARLAQYEKPLTKGHKTTLREKREKDPEKIAKRKTEKRERSQVRGERGGEGEGERGRERERERERKIMLRVRYPVLFQISL